jgi:hypothetical protein
VMRCGWTIIQFSVGVKKLGEKERNTRQASAPNANSAIYLEVAARGFIAGVCCVCDNLGIESCKTGADVPAKGTEQT